MKNPDMSPEEKRIKALRERAAAKEEKAKNLPMVLKLQAGAAADRARADKREAAFLKKKASTNRQEDTHIKIVLGAGLILLDQQTLKTVMSKIYALLKPHDKKSVVEWCEARGIDFDKSATPGRSADESDAKASSLVQPNVTPPARDPIGNALKIVIGSMAEAELGLLAPEILHHASPTDRAILEDWFTSQNRGLD